MAYFFFGGYELKETALLADMLREMNAAVVFDIGANLGGHTLAMVAYAQSIHAFEPYKPLADSIEKHIKINQIENVQIHNFGLGDANETSNYYLDQESNNSGTGSFISGHNNAPPIAELQIKKGDDWSDGKRVDLIKIDIEGYEYFALKGFFKTLQQNKPVVLMEVTETSASFFESNGGLNSVVAFDFDLYEVCNPNYHLGLFQTARYSLRKIDQIVPRNASFNILIMPKERSDILSKTNCKITS